jgi:hypothetical protein
LLENLKQPSWSLIEPASREAHPSRCVQLCNPPAQMLAEN